MVFGPDGTFLGLETAGYYCKGEPKQYVSILPLEESEPRQYVSEILPLECFDLWSEPDWEAYRREVAKAVLQGLLANPSFCDCLSSIIRDPFDVSSHAVKYADKLIMRLKKNRSEEPCQTTEQ